MPFVGDIFDYTSGTAPGPAGTTISSTKAAQRDTDVKNAINTTTSIGRGGTGATTAVQAADNISTVGANIASATTTDLSTATGKHVTITGTTTITAFGTEQAGAERKLTFAAALTLTHNATSLILPGGANITTAAGDVFEFVSEGSGNWRCVGYALASGTAIATSGYDAGHLFGLTLSNGTDADHDIDIEAGSCRDEADAADITLSAITKRLDATWASGTGNGGLSSSLSAPANDTWYHVHAIVVGGSADVGFDTSVTAANLVADHSATAYRRIGSILTDGSANIIAFRQFGDVFKWESPPLNYNSTSTASDALLLVTSPAGVGLRVTLSARVIKNAAGDTYMQLGDGDVSAVQEIVARGTASSQSDSNTTDCFVTNTSSQIRFALGNDSGSITSATLRTMGWIDTRGK